MMACNLGSSETQWEYAACANQNFEYSGSQKLYEVGWFNQNLMNKPCP
ncbi:MAG: hypothetical protein R2822_26735 [Spirosomataceae bacterium]